MAVTELAEDYKYSSAGFYANGFDELGLIDNIMG